jgi:hypothetical protein
VKLGLVLECGPEGPDQLVLTCFARRLKPDVVVHAAPMGSKEVLFSAGVEAAENLIQSSGCDMVIIVWDLKPYWEDAPVETCEAEADLLRIKLAGLDPGIRSKIRLLCITWELETWLLANPVVIQGHLSTKTRKAKFKCSSPLSKTDPKAFLIKEFKKVRGPTGHYEDLREAIQIARLIENTSKLRKIDSFARFSALITGDREADFAATGDVCKNLVYQAAMKGR